MRTIISVRSKKLTQVTKIIVTSTANASLGWCASQPYRRNEGNGWKNCKNLGNICEKLWKL